MTTIYKICTRDAWNHAVAAGEFLGAEIDLKDGFIHFSAAHQVHETATRHFRGQPNLVLVSVDDCRLGDSLKWEPSRGGDLFPHLYSPLSVTAAIAVYDLPLNPDGTHQFPPLSDAAV